MGDRFDPGNPLSKIADNNGFNRIHLRGEMN